MMKVHIQINMIASLVVISTKTLSLMIRYTNHTNTWYVQTDDKYNTKRIFKSIWNDFKRYKNNSVSNKSYNPKVKKYIIPVIDFTDININNFIIFYLNKYGKDNKCKLYEITQYLKYCFLNYEYSDDLSIAFKSFPKALRTWNIIHQKNKNIRIQNIPITDSDVKGIKGISSNKLSNGGCFKMVSYVVVGWHNHHKLCNQIPFGLFSNRQIMNYEIILKLGEFMKSSSQKSKTKHLKTITDCLIKYEITQEYFIKNTRKEFVELLKENCNTKISLAIKIWNHFTK